MSILREGPLASRPNGPLPADFEYHATDTGQTFKWNGGSWMVWQHGWESVEPPTLTGNRIKWPGPVLTSHDYVDLTPRIVAGDGAAGYAAYVSGGQLDNGIASWRFAATGTPRIKWTWLPPDGWEAMQIRIGWFIAGGGSGNVVWRYLQAHSCIGNTLVAAPSIINTHAPVPVPAPLGTGWVYTNLTPPIAVPTLACPLGGAIQSIVHRVGSDGGDTYADPADIFLVTATRMDASDVPE